MLPDGGAGKKRMNITYRPMVWQQAGGFCAGYPEQSDVDSMISASLLLILGLSVSCFLVCAALAPSGVAADFKTSVRGNTAYGYLWAPGFSTRIEVRGNDEATCGPAF